MIGGQLVSVPYGLQYNPTTGRVETNPNTLPVTGGAAGSAVSAQVANANYNQGAASPFKGVDTTWATPSSLALYQNASYLAGNARAPGAVSGEAQILSNGIIANNLTGGTIGTGPSYVTTPGGIVTLGAAANPTTQTYQNLALFGAGVPGIQVGTGGTYVNKQGQLEYSPLLIPQNPAYQSAANQFIGAAAAPSDQKLQYPSDYAYGQAVNALPTRAAQELFVSRNDDPRSVASWYQRYGQEAPVTIQDVGKTFQSSAAYSPIASFGDTKSQSRIAELIGKGYDPIAATTLALEEQRQGSTGRAQVYYAGEEARAAGLGVQLPASASELMSRGWKPYAGNVFEAAGDTFYELLQGYPSKGAIGPLSGTTPLPTQAGIPTGLQVYGWNRAIAESRGKTAEPLVGTYAPAINLAASRYGQIYQGIGVTGPFGDYERLAGIQYNPGLSFAENGAIRVEPTALSPPGATTVYVPAPGMVAPSGAGAVTGKGTPVAAEAMVGLPMPFRSGLETPAEEWWKGIPVVGQYIPEGVFRPTSQISNEGGGYYRADILPVIKEISPAETKTTYGLPGVFTTAEAAQGKGRGAEYTPRYIDVAGAPVPIPVTLSGTATRSVYGESPLMAAYGGMEAKASGIVSPYMPSIPKEYEPGYYAVQEAFPKIPGVSQGSLAYGIYSGIKEKPLMTAVTTAIGYGLGAGITPVSGFLETQAVKEGATGALARGNLAALNYAIPSLYGADVYFRSTKPGSYEISTQKLGNIIGTEVGPLAVGGVIGSSPSTSPRGLYERAKFDVAILQGKASDVVTLAKLEYPGLLEEGKVQNPADYAAYKAERALNKNAEKLVAYIDTSTEKFFNPDRFAGEEPPWTQPSFKPISSNYPPPGRAPEPRKPYAPEPTQPTSETAGPVVEVRSSNGMISLQRLRAPTELQSQYTTPEYPTAPSPNAERVVILEEEPQYPTLPPGMKSPSPSKTAVDAVVGAAIIQKKDVALQTVAQEVAAIQQAAQSQGAIWASLPTQLSFPGLQPETTARTLAGRITNTVPFSDVAIVPRADVITAAIPRTRTATPQTGETVYNLQSQPEFPKIPTTRFPTGGLPDIGGGGAAGFGRRGKRAYREIFPIGIDISTFGISGIGTTQSRKNQKKRSKRGKKK